LDAITPTTKTVNHDSRRKDSIRPK